MMPVLRSIQFAHPSWPIVTTGPPPQKQEQRVLGSVRGSLELHAQKRTNTLRWDDGQTAPEHRIRTMVVPGTCVRRNAYLRETGITTGTPALSSCDTASSCINPPICRKFCVEIVCDVVAQPAPLAHPFTRFARTLITRFDGYLYVSVCVRVCVVVPRCIDLGKMSGTEVLEQKPKIT